MLAKKQIKIEKNKSQYKEFPLNWEQYGGWECFLSGLNQTSNRAGSSSPSSLQLQEQAKLGVTTQVTASELCWTGFLNQKPRVSLKSQWINSVFAKPASWNGPQVFFNGTNQFLFVFNSWLYSFLFLPLLHWQPYLQWNVGCWFVCAKLPLLINSLVLWDPVNLL